MNAEKLRRLQSQVRIGGKGTPRRKKKVMHQSAATDDKKLQSSLKKLSVSTIPGIEEVNIIKDDLTVIHFNNPKAQASLSANTFAVTGHGETKKIVEMLPEILPQLGQDTVMQLRMFANTMSGSQTNQSNIAGTALENVTEEDEVPMLVNDFEEVAKLEETKSKIATKQKVEPKSEQDAAKNKEKDGTVPQNIARKVDAPKVESTAKNAEKMDKKAKKQQNKQSANGAAKNKPESANNETKQQKNENTNKQEIISAVTVEKKLNEAAPPIEQQEFRKKSQDKCDSEVLDAKNGEAVKEELVKPTTTTTHSPQTMPQSNKSASKENQKAPQQKQKDDKTMNDNKSVQETKSETIKEAKESSKHSELGETLHCKDDQKITQRKNQTSTDANAPKAQYPTLTEQNDQKTQQGTKDLKAHQQTGAAVSPQPTDSEIQQAPKGVSPQPKNASSLPKDHKSQPATETKDIKTHEAPKGASPQPRDQKAPPTPKGVSPQPKDIKAQTSAKDATLQSNDKQTLKTPLQQPKNQNFSPKPKGVSPQPKDVDTTLQSSNDLKTQPITKDDAQQSMESKTQQAPKCDLSSMDLKKDVSHQHLGAQQPRKSVSPQPKDKPPKIDLPKPKDLSAQNILDQPKDLKAQPASVKDNISSPTTDTKAPVQAKMDEHQKASEIENKSLYVTSDIKENKKQTGTSPDQIKIEDKTSAPMDTNKIENKSISEKPETQNVLVSGMEINIISTTLSENEKKDQVKIVSQNKDETLSVDKKQVCQQQIPTAVIEKATIQIDEVISAATKEVAKLPTTTNQTTDVAQVFPIESSAEIKSSGSPAGAMSKKDDTQGIPANVSTTKPTNHVAQAKSGKSVTLKPNQQVKQTPAKTPDKLSISAKPTNIQQKPSAPPTKKSPTNTPPTTPTEPTAVKIKEAKPDAQKKPTNQSAQKQSQTKPNTSKPSTSATKTTPNSSPATGSSPKKTPPSTSTQQENKPSKPATPPKASENNAAKSKQTTPPKADVKKSTKPIDESKPQQNTSPKSANNQPQTTPKANP